MQADTIVGTGRGAIRLGHPVLSSVPPARADTRSEPWGCVPPFWLELDPCRAGVGTDG